MNNVKVDLGGDVGNAGLSRGDRAVSQHFERIWIKRYVVWWFHAELG